MLTKRSDSGCNPFLLLCIVFVAQVALHAAFILKLGLFQAGNARIFLLFRKKITKPNEIIGRKRRMLIFNDGRLESLFREPSNLSV